MINPVTGTSPPRFATARDNAATLRRNAALRSIGQGALLETAFLALTVVFGLQILRVLLPGLVFYIRDSLGSSPVLPGVYALGLFLLAFLAPLVSRYLGPARTLTLTAGGLALIRTVEQLVSWPGVDLVLTTLGTALFFLFIPTYIGHVRARVAEGRSIVAFGLLLGIAADTAIKGTFATLDLSWQPGVVTRLLVVFLSGLHLTLLWHVVRDAAPAPADHSGLLQAAPLVALGPILFLESLLF